ncbi:CU044_5270 family protein [Streptomyces sp. NPDC050738]|uniref:CU044_5270 family protein n=1 Tax=Streptomyces sp. NPDC050738 TaxID=3154744 RepID=UPI00343219EB
MDDLMQVREWEADVPPPSDEARSAARVRLQSAVHRESRRGASAAPSRRLMFRVAAGATVAAAAAVAGTAVVATKGGGNRGAAPRMAPLSAVQVLHKAADRSRSRGNGLPAPRNDQYMYIKTYIERKPMKGGGTPRTRTWTDESWMSVDGRKPSRRQDHGTFHDDPPMGPHQAPWPPTVYTKLQAMPTDPDALLRALRHSTEPSPVLDSLAFSQLCMLMMGTRVMPPGLQAAAFEAVAKLPGVRLDRDEVDTLGRRGVSVSYPQIANSFLFDRRTYEYLGFRTKIRGAQKDVWYTETRSLVRLGVVDFIGQRPPG